MLVCFYNFVKYNKLKFSQNRKLLPPAVALQRLREQPDLTKADLIAAVKPDIPDDVLGRTFEIAASFLLGVRIDSDNILQARFSLTAIPSNIDGMDNDIMPSTLTLQHLCSKYGYIIRWTSDLSEHLVVDKVYREIKVYEHLVCLRNHKKYSSLPLPASIVEEAIDTLVVLFPPNQVKTKRFLESEGKDFSGLGFCNLEKRRNLSEYRFFRNRMSELEDIINCPPMAFHQRVLENVWMTAAIASQCNCCDSQDGIKPR
ncbi:hypothetical protein GGR51DRAFT_563823 [Nemania sp. FL0031]|nr:hypothetical protein GGR51DRAFT_563823 [Nemania sp. FL0031]